MFVNNSMVSTDSMLAFRLITNHGSHVVTKNKKETVMRCQFHRRIEERIIENTSRVATSSSFERTIILLRLENSHLGAPDDNLGWRKGVISIREVLNR